MSKVMSTDRRLTFPIPSAKPAAPVETNLAKREQIEVGFFDSHCNYYRHVDEWACYL